MKMFKLLGRLVLGLFVSAVLLILVALAINWNDRPPSVDARRLAALIADRPQLPDADNAYIYELGFDAPAEQDPVAVGTQRRDWLETMGREEFDPSADPLTDGLKFARETDPARRAFKDACQEESRLRCASEFEQLAAAWQATEQDG